MLKKILFSQYTWLLLILLGGFLVRLYKIDNPVADWHSWRQADTASVSKTYYEQGINLFYPRYHDISSIQTGIFNPKGYRMVEFPLYNALHAGMAHLLPSLPFDLTGRLVSVILSMFSVYLIFLIGRRSINSLGGVLAAFFFAFLPFNIYFSRVILPEPIGTLFALWSLWLFIRFIDTDKNSYFLASAVIFALAMLIKPFTLFYCVAFIYLAVEKYGLDKLFKSPRLLIKALVFANIVLVPFFAWRIWINLYPQGIPFFNWAFNGDHIRFRPAFFRWIFAERIGNLILGTWGLIPFSLGILHAKKGKLLNHFLLLGMLLYLVVVATANVRHDYYQTFIIPSICLILAQGVVSVFQSGFFNKYLSVPLIGFSILIMLGTGVYRIKDFYQVNHPEIIEAGKAIQRISDKDALVIAPYTGDTAFLYQTNRWGWPAVDDSIDRIIDKGADYYVSVNKGDADTTMLQQRFTVIEETPLYIIIDLHQPKD